MSEKNEFQPEIKALETVLTAVGRLSEEQRQFVISTTASRFNLNVDNVDSSKNRHNQKGESSDISGISPKEFLRDKKPLNEVQRIACLAYYLTHARNQKSFKTIDLKELNTEAAGRKLSNPSFTVRNATSQSNLLAPAGKGGMKQITAHGEECVNALPDQEKVKAVIRNMPKRRVRAKRKRSAKK